MRTRQLHATAAALIALVILVVPAESATITTGYVWHSGWCAGPYIDLTAQGGDVTVDSFDVYFRGTLPRDVSLYYKAGSYAGFEATAGAWTLIGTVAVLPLGDGILTPVPLGGVVIPAGQTYGFKVWDNLGTGGAQGGGLILESGGSSAASMDLTLTSNMYTCDFAFSGVSSNWGFQGTVNYTVGTPPAIFVRTVSSTSLNVYPGETGVDLQVSIENGGVNSLDLQSVILSFTDSMAVDRSSEYQVTPVPGQPTSIAPGATELLDWTIDVLASAAPGTITIDASADALDSVTMQPASDPAADTPHVWTVQSCGYSQCGDCDGNMRVDILDALLVAQVAAALVVSPVPGSPQFNECNVQGLVFPDPLAIIDVLDALDIARFAAGLTVLSCC